MNITVTLELNEEVISLLVKGLDSLPGKESRGLANALENSFLQAKMKVEMDEETKRNEVKEKVESNEITDLEESGKD